MYREKSQVTNMATLCILKEFVSNTPLIQIHVCSHSSHLITNYA